MSYRKIKAGEPMYEMIQANKKAGMWVCDSWDHNEPGGCSNPRCFKHPLFQGPSPALKELIERFKPK